jgi:hypothetical protein
MWGVAFRGAKAKWRTLRPTVYIMQDTTTSSGNMRKHDDTCPMNVSPGHYHVCVVGCVWRGVCGVCVWCDALWSFALCFLRHRPTRATHLARFGLTAVCASPPPHNHEHASAVLSGGVAGPASGTVKSAPKPPARFHSAPANIAAGECG